MKTCFQTFIVNTHPFKKKKKYIILGIPTIFWLVKIALTIFSPTNSGSKIGKTHGNLYKDKKTL